VSTSATITPRAANRPDARQDAAEPDRAERGRHQAAITFKSRTTTYSGDKVPAVTDADLGSANCAITGSAVVVFNGRVSHHAPSATALAVKDLHSVRADGDIDPPCLPTRLATMTRRAHHYLATVLAASGWGMGS
jgi:hypothetical protein